MKRSRLTQVLVLAVVAVSAVTVRAQDAVRFEVIDSSLTPAETRVIGLDREGVRFIDRIERRRVTAWSRVTALSRPGGAARSVGLGVFAVDLIDGQRLIGEVAAGSDAETVRVVSPRVGSRDVSIERLRRIARPGEDGLFAAVAGGEQDRAIDELAFVNGDRADVFVIEVGASVLADVDGRERSFDWELVRSLTLATPSESPEGPRVWLTSGEIVRASPADDGAWVTGTGERFDAELDEVIAYAPDCAAVIGLSSLAVVSVEPSPSRVYAESPAADDASAALGITPLRASGPMTVAWQLPDGAWRVSLSLELEHSHAGAPGPWASCAARLDVVDAGGRATGVGRVSLDRDTPTGLIAGSLAGAGRGGRQLRLVIEESDGGPVQDAVVIRGGLLGLRP